MTPTKQPEAFTFRFDPHSGVPVFRQIIDQVQAGIAASALTHIRRPAPYRPPGSRRSRHQPQHRPPRLSRKEIRGIVDTQQGTGTFIASRKIEQSKAERDRVLAQLTSEFVSRAGAGGFTLQDLLDSLREFQSEAGRKRR